MPAVPVPVRRERAARLRSQARENALRFHSRLLGQAVSVLTETASAGHTEHFSPVRLTTEAQPSRLIRARVTAAEPGFIMAEAA